MFFLSFPEKTKSRMKTACFPLFQRTAGIVADDASLPKEHTFQNTPDKGGGALREMAAVTEDGPFSECASQTPADHPIPPITLKL